jgi:hypothetical protein
MVGTGDHAEPPLFIDRRPAARIISLSYSTLAHLARSPAGPPLCRVGRRVVYRTEDLVAWVESHASRPRRRRGRPRKTRAKGARPKLPGDSA